MNFLGEQEVLSLSIWAQCEKETGKGNKGDRSCGGVRTWFGSGCKGRRRLAEGDADTSYKDGAPWNPKGLPARRHLTIAATPSCLFPLKHKKMVKNCWTTSTLTCLSSVHQQTVCRNSAVKNGESLFAVWISGLRSTTCWPVFGQETLVFACGTLKTKQKEGE